MIGGRRIVRGIGLFPLLSRFTDMIKLIPSALRLSVRSRLAYVSLALLALWLAVAWAFH